MLVVGSESKLDQRPRVRNHLGLPSVVGLVALHGSLRIIVPQAGPVDNPGFGPTARVAAGQAPGYGRVPARKIVPSWRPAPRCRTRKTTSCPLFNVETTFENSSSPFTGCLLTSRTMSPRCNPTSSAKDPGFTS